MTALDALREVVVPVVVFVVLPVYFWYQRDRRKSRAETAVAERTIGADISTKEAGGLGASVAFVQEAFRVERESKDREIQSLSQKVAKMEHDNEDKDRKIHNLELAEEEKDRVIAELRRQIRELTERLSRLETRPA